MKALRLEEIGKVELVDVKMLDIKDNELLIRTGASTVCTSDLNDISENPFDIELPSVIGHEGAGIVEKIGAGVKGFKEGDRVAAHPVHPCDICYNCKNGMGHLCLNMGHFGINMPGTFAEYFVVRKDRARVIHEHVDFPCAALAEPVCVCLEALAQAKVSQGDDLLVIGDGPFGIMMVRLAEALKLSKIVVAGRHDFRLSFAGDAVTVNTKKVKDPKGEIIRNTDGEGFDAVILAAGNKQAVQEGLDLLKAKGRLVVFSPVTGKTPVDIFKVLCKELEIIGACNDDDMMDKAVEMLADENLGIKDLITQQLPIEEFRKAFELAAGGREEAMKVAFIF